MKTSVPQCAQNSFGSDKSYEVGLRSGEAWRGMEKPKKGKKTGQKELKNLLDNQIGSFLTEEKGERLIPLGIRVISMNPIRSRPA